MKRSLLIFWVLYMLIAFPAFSESGILVPREVFVGDTAELSFETNAFASILASGSVLIVPPSDFAVSPDLTITGIQVKQGKDSGEVLVRFVPWVSGVLQIPPFSLKKISVTPPQVRISSLIEKTGRNVLESPRSPLLIPGTTYLVYGGIVLFLAAVLALLFVSVKIRKYFSGTAGKKNSGRRVGIAIKQLKLLERKIKKSGQKEWYGKYAAILRSYFGSFCTGASRSFSSATGAEVVARLSLKLGSNAILADVQALLSRIDTARFSGHDIVDSCADDIALARSLIASLEAEGNTDVQF